EAIVRHKKNLGLPLDKKIILYAPTWRDDEFSADDKYEFRPQISFEKLQEELKDDYVLIVKYHYLIMDAVDWTPYKGFIYHFDQSRDIAELFLVSDLLITDYSSVMFDYSILRRPMFFFAYDFYKYKNELRGFYFSYRKEMPGPISATTEELIRDIREYDASLYEERYDKFCKKYNEIDDGNASKHVAVLIDSLIPSKQMNVFYENE
ncbi:MAG: CDP-glycerol glycerophosphotransferase family protein, partial [Eubacterium sp.]|nr:CDP-glycerol glycerophosphotransferase family protein [Eubacterium sp.]